MLEKPIWNVLHTETVRGKPLRFFAPPKPAYGPQAPWHSQDDLMRCMDLPRDVRRRFQAMNREPQFADEQMVIATPIGITTAASHGMALALIDAMASTGRAPKAFTMEYGRAAVAAIDVMTVGMTDQQRLQFIVDGYRLSNGLGPVSPN